MNTNTPELQNYINSQRANGISDEVIYRALLASGWQHDAAVRALSTQENAAIKQPDIYHPAEAQADVSQVNPGIVKQDDTPEWKPVESQNINDKSRKKVALIGKIMIGLGILAAIVSMYPVLNLLALVFAVAQIMVGVGILSYNKLAYTLFNILAILAMISSVFILPNILGVLYVIPFMPSLEALALVMSTIVLGVGQVIFYIYGGIVLHKKEVRALFSKKTA